jgi:gamma-glutamylcyclotransferase (GGCT)/AIG2-like uncharacterized protein YtfP
VNLFVYGTLMGGAPQGALLAGLRRSPATVRGRLYAMPAGYPALVLGGAARVSGELVQGVDPNRLVVLDRYEGVDDGLYERVQVEVDVGLERVSAEAYVMDHPERRGGRLVADGRWRRVARR